VVSETFMPGEQKPDPITEALEHFGNKHCNAAPSPL
jgi:hypothetical protein